MEQHAHHDHSSHMGEFRKKFWVSLILTVPVLALSEMIQDWFSFSLTVVYQKEMLFLLSALIYLYGGAPFLRGALEEIRAKKPGMMTLIGMAISVAFFYSSATVFLIFGRDFFWELATLIDVMLLGHWLEARSVLGASRSLEELVRIMPVSAHLFKGTDIVEVSVSELEKRDIVLVRPGEKIPSDGVVVDGNSYVNEALLTGESKPVRKKKGDRVIGASINEEGSLRVKIDKTGEETYISQVVRLVREAQDSRSHTQDLADRSAALLFYVALGAGILTYIVWFMLSGPDAALERAVTVLIIACPHALGLAIPLVVAISTSITAKNGILLRDRKAFEMVRNVTAVVFDKTGTLTEGKRSVAEVVAVIPENELLSLTASLEVNSEHTLAKAILEYAKEKKVDLPMADDFKAMPGIGISGRVLGKAVSVGGPELLKELNIVVDDERVEKLQRKGNTVIHTIVDGKYAGTFALEDRIRKESYAAVKQLKKMGIKVFMLTGDSRAVAGWVAGDLRIDEYFAQVLPHQKAEKITALKEKGFRVAMVGDGINDAPALATADIGIAIGAGTDVAIESADIILVRSDPRDVTKAIELAKETYIKMVENLWWAAGYNIIAIPLAAGVFAGYGLVISPALGAVVMSLSTIIVALNAQTLRKYEPKNEAFKPAPVEKDPVCGMEVSVDSLYKIEFEGRAVYFCSEHCMWEFNRNPEKFRRKLPKR